MLAYLPDEGAEQSMAIFQNMVAELRSCESVVYTICLTMLPDEARACEAAKRILIELFGDSDFWMKPEKDRQAYMTRICIRHCLHNEKYVGKCAETASTFVS